MQYKFGPVVIYFISSLWNYYSTSSHNDECSFDEVWSLNDLSSFLLQIIYSTCQIEHSIHFDLFINDFNSLFSVWNQLPEIIVPVTSYFKHHPSINLSTKIRVFHHNSFSSFMFFLIACSVFSLRSWKPLVWEKYGISDFNTLTQRTVWLGWS